MTPSPPQDLLGTFSQGLLAGHIRIVDLTHALSTDFPTLALPPELGQCQGFRIEQVSAYDERGASWYWNNISCSEHTGTHFDAPVHWITGKDHPNNSVDTMDLKAFIGPACVVDCSKEVAANADFNLDVPHLEAWEAQHGKIPAGAWVLFRTD